MISRHWRGLARAAYAEDYVRHLRDETFPAIARLPGFVGASILRRDLPDGVEFLVVTRWDSLDSIRAFAGDDINVAVVPRHVQDMMADFDRTVSHYEVVQ